MSTLQATNDNENLMDVQIRLEQEMTSRGVEKFFREVSKAKQTGREDGTAYGQQILTYKLDALAAGIKAWKEESGSGTAGRLSTAYKLVKDINDHVLAFLTLKNVLAGVSSIHTLQYVGVAIGTAVEDELRMQGVRDESQREYDKIVAGAKKRGRYSYKHVYAMRIADKHQDWERWARTDRLHVGVKLLDILMSTIGLVEVTHQKIYRDQSIKYVRALPETLEWIEQKEEVASLLRPFYEPMVVQPKDWSDPFNGGYVSNFIKPIKLVKTKNKAYLEELRNVDMPIVYEAVNALQRTPWQINSQVLEVMRTLWENGSTVAGLPPRDGIPLPEVPHNIEESEEIRKEFRIESAKVHMQNLSILGQRIGFNIALDIAKRYEKFRKIYFPYQMDFRSRVYAVPRLNPQGADYQKSLLRFANGKPLGSEGWKWLAIHGANVAGYDKASLEDRVNWVQDNEEEILRIAADPYSHRGWCSQVGDVEIDKPWQFLAFCYEWAGYVEHGDEYVSKLPVALDGSCSGLQHFSAMLRDDIGGEAVNLKPHEKPADVYAMVAAKVQAQCELDAESGTGDQLAHSEEGRAYVKEGTKTLAQQWLKFGITRKTCKRSVMTLAYGSKQFGFKEQLMEDILRPNRMSPDFPFSGDGYRAAAYMAGLIWKAVNETLVKASEAMKWLQGAASLAAAEDLPVRWTTPIGFPVMQAYHDMDKHKVKTALNGKLVYLTMYKEKEQLDRRKQGSGVSPNFIHSCDAAHLMLTVVRAKQDGINNFAMIHDSFGTSAGDTEELFRIVRESFVELYQEVDVINNFKDEVVQQLSPKNLKKLPEVPSRGSLDLSGVLESRYCFA